jgi:hypothetical protein
MGQKITINAAADRELLCRSTLYRWIRQGRINVYKYARDAHSYVDIDEVKAELQQKGRRKWSEVLPGSRWANRADWKRHDRMNTEEGRT